MSKLSKALHLDEAPALRHTIDLMLHGMVQVQFYQVREALELSCLEAGLSPETADALWFNTLKKLGIG